MRVFDPRVALSLSVLVGLAGACASAGRPAKRAESDPQEITAQDLEHRRGEPIEQVLQDKVPGVVVWRGPDGSIGINIRGVNSFYSGTSPLYVVDGVEFPPGPGGALMGLNPYDIQTIKVLKRPEEIALYGVRGANGVIVITTKRPGKP